VDIPFHIFDTDGLDRVFWGWYDLELRWPYHYASLIESISIIRPNLSSVRVLYCKGKKEISSSKKSKHLDGQANHIYEEIRLGLADR
jgi:hypothetical protein